MFDINSVLWPPDKKSDFMVPLWDAMPPNFDE